MDLYEQIDFLERKIASLRANAEAWYQDSLLYKGSRAAWRQTKSEYLRARAFATQLFVDDLIGLAVEG